MGKKKKFNDHPFAYHQEIELEISTLTNLGLGLGRIPLGAAPQGSAESPSVAPAASGGVTDPHAELPRAPGWVVMVPFTLPGERVRVRVFRNHKNYSEADLVEVLTPSPDRVKPVCPLFGRCGGCQYQHLDYAGQLRWKQRQVAELLEHMAGITFPVSPVVPSPREYGYRSKITPHFAAPRLTPAFAARTGHAAAAANSAGAPEDEAQGLPPAAEIRDSGDQVPDAEAAGSLGTAAGSAPQSPGGAGTPFPIGFLRQGTRFDIVDVSHCPIATEAINARLTAVRDGVHAKGPTYTRGATLLLREASGVVTTDYDAVITETIGAAGAQPSGPSSQANRTGAPAPGPADGTREPATPGTALPTGSSSGVQPSPFPAPSAVAAPIRLHFLARDFFQNNPFILPAFTGYVRQQAAASGAKLLVDAYCGSGLFALTAASAFERVAGVEISESSVRFAKENAAANGITNATFLAADAAAIFAGLSFPAGETAVIIDPPRKGCDESFLQQLFTFGPRAVVYVSCDPATQMRDLRHFLAAGYRLTAAQPFDLFPQTRHLECVLTLARGEQPPM